MGPPGSGLYNPLFLTLATPCCILAMYILAIWDPPWSGSTLTWPCHVATWPCTPWPSHDFIWKAIWDPQVMFYIFHCISILTGHDCNPAPVKSYILVTSWFSMLTGSWFVPSHDFQSWPGHDFLSWLSHDFQSWPGHDFSSWLSHDFSILTRSWFSILTKSWFFILTMSWFSILTGHDFVSWPKLLPNAVMIYSSVGRIALRQDALLPNAVMIFYLDWSWFSRKRSQDFWWSRFTWSEVPCVIARRVVCIFISFLKVFWYILLHVIVFLHRFCLKYI